MARSHGLRGGIDSELNERQGSTEVQDIYGTRIRLTRDGLSYEEKYVPFAEIGDMRSESQVCLNPGTKLFEVTVFRGDGPDLIIWNLPLHTAEQLREAIIDALRERHT